MFVDLSPLRKHRDYRLLFIGQMVSLFGSAMTMVAVPYQVYALTHSSFAVGMLGAANLVPMLVFALLGGALADSMDRKRLLIVSEIFMALCSGVLVVNALASRPSVTLIFIASAAMSALNGFHRPALDAATPRLVDREHLKAVSALGGLRYSIATIAGPALGGLLMASFGIVWAYAIDLATFLICLVSLAAIRSIPPAEDSLRPGLGTIAEGLRYAMGRPELIGTYVVDIIAMLFAMPSALFPAMSVAWGGEVAMGWLTAALPLGSFAITLFSGWTARVERHGAAVVISAALWGVAIVALGFAPSLSTAVICLVLAGAADSVSAIFRGTIWNETIPSELRGRLAGVEMISYLSGPLLGNTRAGWVASMSSNAVSIVSGGAISVVGILLCAPLLPVFWRYRSHDRTSR